MLQSPSHKFSHGMILSLRFSYKANIQFYILNSNYFEHYRKYNFIITDYQCYVCGLNIAGDEYTVMTNLRLCPFLTLWVLVGYSGLEANFLICNKKKEKNSCSSLLYPHRGCNVFGFMRLKRLFRNIRFYIGSTLLSHFVAIILGLKNFVKNVW